MGNSFFIYYLITYFLISSFKLKVLFSSSLSVGLKLLAMLNTIHK